MNEFSKTRKGQKFFETDLPKIAAQLERIANALEKKNLIEEKKLIIEKKKFKNEGLGDFQDQNVS